MVPRSDALLMHSVRQSASLQNDTHVPDSRSSTPPSPAARLYLQAQGVSRGGAAGEDEHARHGLVEAVARMQWSQIGAVRLQYPEHCVFAVLPGHVHGHAGGLADRHQAGGDAEYGDVAPQAGRLVAVDGVTHALTWRQDGVGGGGLALQAQATLLYGSPVVVARPGRKLLRRQGMEGLAKGGGWGIQARGTSSPTDQPRAPRAKHVHSQHSLTFEKTSSSACPPHLCFTEQLKSKW